MKIDEAIAYFKKQLRPISRIVDERSMTGLPFHSYVVEYNSLRMAIEAIEKQIPQKVVPVGSYGRFCPVCDEQVFVSIAKYCCFCGQALLQEVK